MRYRTRSLFSQLTIGVSGLRVLLSLCLFFAILCLPAESGSSFRLDPRRKGIDIYSNGRLTLLPLSFVPSAFTSSADGSRIYIANPAGTLEVYDSASLLLTSTLPIQENVSALAVDSQTSKLYLSAGKELSVLDGSSQRILSSRRMDSDISTIAVDAMKGRLFVGTFSGSILMLESSTLSVVGSYFDASAIPLELAVESSSSKLYVRDRQSISIFDTGSLQWKSYLNLDGLPGKIVLSPDGSRLYVALSNEKSIAVFETEGDSLVDWYSTDEEWNQTKLDSERWHVDSRLHLFTLDGQEVLPEQLKEAGRSQTEALTASPDLSAAGAELDLSSISGSKDYVSLDSVSTGGFVGTWTNLDNKDGSGDGVFAREYNGSGGADKKEFVVNKKTSGDQGNSTVAAASSGDYVIVWRDSEGNDGDTLGVFFRRYSNGGDAKDSDDKKLSSQTNGAQKQPSVDSQPDGDFVAAWTGPSGSKKGVFARRFAASGSPQGNDQEVHSTNSSEWAPDVATNSSGRYVVVWREGENDELLARVYSSSGDPVTAPFKVSSSGSPQFAPSVGMDEDGNFVIAWQENNANSVLYRLFSANGSPKSSPRKGSTVGDKDYAPSLSMTPDGKFCIAWRDNNLVVWARAFNAQGDPIMDEMKASTSGGDQFSPACAMDKDGSFLVAWKFRGGGGDTVIKGRKLTPSGSSGGDLAVECSADPESGKAPLDVSFSANPSGGNGNYEYAWDFGDGSASSSEQDPSHKYDAEGTFKAKVVVTSGSSTATCKQTITVNSTSGGGELAVSCSADPQSGKAPLDVAFSANPSGGDGNYEFAWNFGDGSAASTEKNPSHKYQNEGTFKAKVVVTSGSDTASCKQPITVEGSTSGKLSISELSKKAGDRPVKDLTMKVIGTGFEDGAKVNFNDSGIKVTKTAFVSEKKIKITVDIENGAFLGMHDVTVTNPGGKSVTGIALFKVEESGKYPAPKVTSVDPSKGSAGKSIDVKIIGSDFANDLAALSADFGNGISVKNFQWNSSDELRVTLDIKSDATCGPRNVVVSNGSSSSDPCVDCFKVKAGKLAITDVSPASLPVGSTNEVVTIKGSNFDDSSKAEIKGTDTVSQTVMDCSTILLTISIPQDANLGDKKVKVQNSDGEKASRTEVFKITD